MCYNYVINLWMDSDRMKLRILGSGAGLPSKDRHTQCIILDLVDEINQYYCIDASEGMQHQILHTNIKPSKIKNMFITHLHGDHIYGLPGFLSSRDHLGGKEIPLTIYGPPGLKSWIETTLDLSRSHLSYNLTVIEVSPYDTFLIDNMSVEVIPMEHNIECYGYIFSEQSEKGELLVERLRDIGISPGPIYKEIKESDTFIHENTEYLTADFLGPTKVGRKVVIHGDTKVIKDDIYKHKLDGADVIVHESTYLDGEIEKAQQYHHSEISEVLSNYRSIDYEQLIITHISNRYEDEDLAILQERYKDHCQFAEDFLEITIPRKS